MRRLLTVEIRAITEDLPAELIERLVASILLEVDVLDLGELDVKATLGDRPTVNTHDHAVPLPSLH